MKLLNKKNLKYFTVILFLILVQALRYFPFKFGDWNQTQLSFSYRYGFIQRAFMGSVLDIISQLFSIPWQYMRYVYVVATLVIFTFVLFLIAYKSINKKAIDSNTCLFSWA